MNRARNRFATALLAAAGLASEGALGAQRDGGSAGDAAIDGGKRPIVVAQNAVGGASGSAGRTRDEPEAPNSRDALFGETPDGDYTAPRVSGFYEFTLAYTYADPKHWSRAVSRLAVDARGTVSDAKWKLGARFDFDPVYMGSDFYLSDVKRNQRADAIWRENYLDFAAGDWDFRIGAQNIVWGDVVGLFVADVVSAKDLRDFLLPSFDVIRIPQWAARAEYTAGDAHVELVWIPVPAFDDVGKPGSDFYPYPLPSPTPEGIAAAFADPDRPARTIENSSYGVRGSALVDGWDFSAFYYRGFSTSPTFYRVGGASPTQPYEFQPRYDRVWQLGGTFNKDLGTAVLHGEAVYTHGQNFATLNASAPEGVVGRSTLDWAASLDIPFTEVEGRVNLQVFQRYYFDGGDQDVAIKGGDFGVSAFVSAKVASTFEPQLLWIQGINGGGSLVRPRLNWYPARNTTVAVGLDIFMGATNGFLGRYNNRDRAYGEVRYTF